MLAPPGNTGPDVTKRRRPWPCSSPTFDRSGPALACRLTCVFTSCLERQIPLRPGAGRWAPGSLRPRRRGADASRSSRSGPRCANSRASGPPAGLLRRRRSACRSWAGLSVSRTWRRSGRTQRRRRPAVPHPGRLVGQSPLAYVLSPPLLEVSLLRKTWASSPPCKYDISGNLVICQNPNQPAGAGPDTQMEWMR
jgi:hypothetical protein